jgi:hypothetical protein
MTYRYAAEQRQLSFTAGCLSGLAMRRMLDAQEQ